MNKLLFLIFLIFNFKAAINEKVLICGTCKDVSARILKTIKIIEHMGQLFSDYRVLVYENNSIDNTKELIQEWSQNNSKIIIYSEDIDENILKKSFINEDY